MNSPLVLNTSNREFGFTDGAIVVAGLFIVVLPGLFFGLDVTDDGFHLTNQMYCTAVPVPTDTYSWLWLLSDWAGGLWLRVWDTPSLLWGRIGGALTVLASVWIGFVAVRPYFSLSLASRAAGIAFILTGCAYALLINYFTFPGLLAVLATLALQRGCFCTRKWVAFGWLSLAGLLLVALVLSRLTLVCLIVLPLVGLIVVSRTRIPDTPTPTAALQALSVGVITGLVVAGPVLLVTGGVDVLVENGQSMLGISAASDSVFRMVGRQNYVPLDMMRTYLIDCLRAGGMLLVLVLPVFVLHIVERRLTRTVPPSVALLLLCLVTFVPLIGILAPYNRFFTAGMRMYWSSTVVLTFWFASVIVLRGCRHAEVRALIILGLLTSVVTPIGSDQGISKALYGMYILIPVVLLEAHRQAAHTNSSAATVYTMLFRLTGMLIVGAMLVNVPTRDNPNRLQLNTGLTTAALRGVFTTPERAIVVDDIVHQLNMCTRAGDWLLCVNNISMIHFLTGTRPAMGNPWVFAHDYDGLSRKLRAIERMGRPLPCVLIATVNTRNPQWPSIVPETSLYDEDSAFLTQFNGNRFKGSTVLEQLGLQWYYQNDAFVILVPRARQ